MFNTCLTKQAKGRKGQSTVEYIVLVTAVVAVGIAFLTSPAGPFQSKLTNTMSVTTNKIKTMGDRLNRVTTADNSEAGEPQKLYTVDPTKDAI